MRSVMELYGLRYLIIAHKNDQVNMIILSYVVSNNIDWAIRTKDNFHRLKITHCTTDKR